VLHGRCAVKANSYKEFNRLRIVRWALGAECPGMESGDGGVMERALEKRGVARDGGNGLEAWRMGGVAVRFYARPCTWRMRGRF
jgi:hypothetical protein